MHDASDHLTTIPLNRIADLRHPNDALHPIITLIHRGQKYERIVKQKSPFSRTQFRREFLQVEHLCKIKLGTHGIFEHSN